VRQTGQIIAEKENLLALSTTNSKLLEQGLMELRHKKTMQTVMIVGEGTVFLLLLLFGLYKIKQAMDKETALGNQQKNFFLSVTHELKTPIAATKLQLQTLQRPALDIETQQKLIRNALDETERLNSLIDNILLASRLESKEFSFNRQKVHLSKIINQILNRYYSSQLSNGVIKAQLDEGAFAEADEMAMQSVIINLIDNAIKYSGPQAQVQVTLLKGNGHIKFIVADNGSGVHEKDRGRIFEKFYRAGNEETRSTKGTGLGLFIVKYIVNMHQGEVVMRDNKPKGSVFEITLNAA
jgi:signal transduction histidine kinase